MRIVIVRAWSEDRGQEPGTAFHSGSAGLGWAPAGGPGYQRTGDYHVWKSLYRAIRCKPSVSIPSQLQPVAAGGFNDHFSRGRPPPPKKKAQLNFPINFWPCIV